MALRSLGSSLVAKGSPGGTYRKTEERRIETPDLPGRGKVGSIDRAQLEEPLERQVPGGSQKVVGVQPTVESVAGVPGDISSVVGLPSGVSANVPQGAQSQALFQGGVGVPAGRVNPGAAPTVSSSAGGRARPALAYQPEVQSVSKTQVGKPTQVVKVAPDVQGNFLSGILPAITSLGNRSFAEAGGNILPRNFGQAIAGAASKGIEAVGKATGNKAPEFNVSEGLRSFANNVQNTVKGVGSLSKPQATLRSVSQNVQKTVQNVVKQAQSVLRSLFRR